MHAETPSLSPSATPVRPVAPATPKRNKRKKPMSEFEESMLKLHERHIEQKIEMERAIYFKELDLLNLKLKAKQLKIDMLNKQKEQ